MILLLDVEERVVQCVLCKPGHSLKTPLRFLPGRFRQWLLKLKKTGQVNAIGYCFEYGGGFFTEPVTFLKPWDRKKIREAALFCPDKNEEMAGIIQTSMKVFPKAQHAILCNSAFYSGLPEYARTYAIPYEFTTRGVRKFGRQGIAHAWAYERVKRLSQTTAGNCISVYFGDETNVVAMKNGRAVEASDGFMNTCGLVSKTGCGEIDSAIIFHLISQGFSLGAVEDMLTKQSGFRAMAGQPCSLIDILNRKDIRARRAKEIYFYRLLKWIGAYVATLGTLDQVLFMGDKNKVLVDLALKVFSRLSFLGGVKKKKVGLEDVCHLTMPSSRIDGYFLKWDKWQVMSEVMINSLREKIV